MSSDPQVIKEAFGAVEGIPVWKYTLRNRRGMSAHISTFGAAIEAIFVPDRNGVVEDVVLGFDSLEKRLAFGQNRFGVTVGRVANRIPNDEFTMRGTTYKLASSFPPHKHHLHGGPKGFWNRVWDPKLENNSEIILGEDSVGVRLSLFSADGDMGYPGNVNVTAVYTLTDAGELKIVYEATTDRETPIMLTNHAFFNLSGDGKRDITDNLLHIKSDSFPEISPDLIPTGNIRQVTGTPMDFTVARPIGDRIRDDYDMLKAASGGYDLNFIIDRSTKDELAFAARVEDRKSGRTMEVLTNQLCVQFFSANSFNMEGKKEIRYNKYHGFCLEPQGYVNAVNNPSFPSLFVQPGEKYQNIIIYKFIRN